MNETLLRLGRSVVWRWPSLYRPIGYLRKRNNYWLTDYDVWVGGYPRSSNTYTGKALQAHMPGAHVVSQVHLPPPIMRAVDAGKPGVFVIREPASAVVSWTLYSAFNLRHCLLYYIDFHRLLLAYRDRMVIARFEETTGDFPSVLRRFNERYGLALADVPLDDDRIFREIDAQWRSVDGTVMEMQVARPSTRRKTESREAWEQLDRDPWLRSHHARARELYEAFVAAIPSAPDREPASGVVAADAPSQ